MRLVVATVHLVGLGPRDGAVWADEKDAQVARWLRGGQLRDVTPKDAEAPPTPGAFLDAPVSRETRPSPAASPPASKQRRAAPKK
jgi:hypothetical protein